MLPHGRPLISMNQSVPCASRSSSIMNRPCQPNARRKRSAAASVSVDGAIATQALEPDPAGFIMRTRRCPLHATTRSGSARPNTPSPTPAMCGWQIIGSSGSATHVVASRRGASARTKARPRPSTSPVARAARAGLTMQGKRSMRASASAPSISRVSGTLKPALAAACSCSRLSSVSSALASIGPQTRTGIDCRRRWTIQIARSSSGITTGSGNWRTSASMSSRQRRIDVAGFVTATTRARRP